MSSIHLELLDKKRKKVFEKLAIFRKSATLGGGTALFLQGAHRYSLDFDLFLSRGITRKDFRKLQVNLGVKKVGVNTNEQLDIVTRQGVKVTLARYYYQPLFKKNSSSFLPLFSIKDIAADKAMTIGRRAVWRDYVDLFFILKRGYTDILNLLKLSQKKFGVEFAPKLFLEQLVYFQDLEITEISFVKEKYSPNEIQEFLKNKVKELRKVII